MKTFHIIASNASREFEGNDNDTAITVLSHAAVRSFFGFGTEDNQDQIDEALGVLVPHVSAITNGGNTTELESLPASFKNAILNAALEDDAEIEIDYYAAEDNDANEVDGFDPTAGAVIQDILDNGTVSEKDVYDALREEQVSKPSNGSVGPEQPVPPQGTVGEGKHGFVTVASSGGVARAKIDIEDGVTTLRTVLYSKVVQSRIGMDDTAVSNCMVMINGDIINPNNVLTRKVHIGDIIELTPRFASKLGSK